MKALFRTKKNGLIIEDLRDIPMPAQIWKVATPPEWEAQLLKEGETPPAVSVSVTEVIYHRIGNTPDGVPIYENEA